MVRCLSVGLVRLHGHEVYFSSPKSTEHALDVIVGRQREGMRANRLTISVDDALFRALYAEGSRTFETPASVAGRVLREALPDYLARTVRNELLCGSEPGERLETSP